MIEMETTIRQLEIIRDSLGTLEITSTRNNMDVLLGSMQLLDRIIVRLQQQADSEEQTE